jgi:hypothetical protein
MSKRTRLFLVISAGILAAGLGTGLIASYAGLQFTLIGSNGPAELSYIPQDAQIVAYADVRDVMDSEVRRRLLRLERSRDGAGRFEEETGIDLERDVEYVVVSLTGDGSDRPLVLARGRFDADRIETAIRQRGGTVETYNGTRLVVHDDPNIGVAFVEPDLVAVGTSASVRRAIDTKASGRDVRQNEELMRILREAHDGNAWGVARFEALTGAGRLPTDVARQLPPITWFAVTGRLDGGISAVVRAEARDEAAARDLRDVVSGFVALARLQARDRAEFAAVLDSVQLSAAGRAVSLAFSVPPELLDALAATRLQRSRPGIPRPPGDPAP